MVFQWLVYFQKSYLKREWERVNLNKPFRERGRETDRERQRETERAERAETESWDRELRQRESRDRELRQRQRERASKKSGFDFFFFLDNVATQLLEK